ncbi:SMP-30/gluconolactonase/LRE family protein [Azohydromonas caseinilytica]|uniref:SMP-30/gluconolactonase/LRE family protein n=1 Tax=Azohydromonas caseinilytica TaxID=2728836 RepID=A0A848F510_9BURK|nr:SMP-30/gluconolactonase/LRE family protein [Azohydromonas caseinilytica]NML13795.1 SMP-30/gluconolactonase/LRE family protein [Azohydromonas caseinilytica]
MSAERLFEIQPLPLPPSLLGESPFWHPEEGALWWCDIPGRRLNRWDPARGRHDHWGLEAEPGCAAPLQGGRVLLAMRDGLWCFEPHTGKRHRVCKPPYDPAQQRFNDGKADPQGRLWVGTIDDQRQPRAALYRWAEGELERMAGGITTSNGLAWSPDGHTMYWTDTRAHEIRALDFDPDLGTLSRQRVFARFAPRQDGVPYGGRPDGAAVDSEGAYWVAMYEGRRLLRLSPAGQLLQEVVLPVQCPTMPCFGGPDLRTLYLSTARDHRPAEELARDPWAGCVLQMRVPVPGLPVNFARL